MWESTWRASRFPVSHAGNAELPGHAGRGHADRQHLAGVR
jgi:hypothetical protein